MDIWQAIVLGIVEGVTEFLPISSTGHLTILEKLFGYQINDPDITAFTAIIQVGAVLATVIFLRKDIIRIGAAWVKGLVDSKERKHFDYRYGWAIIIGSIPIGIVGLMFKDEIETTLRSLWVVAFALIFWSGAMWLADTYTKHSRHENSVNWKDTLFIGIAQCLALIPGISRSGATMTAGLYRGFDRVTVTKLSFFLSIPALCAAAVLQTATEYSNIANGVGWPATITATVVSFITAYIAVSWLLKFIAKHSYTVFIVYRLALGAILIVLLTTGAIAAV